MFNYLGFPTASVGAYADPLVGAGELPTCSKAGSNPLNCSFPANTTHRNAFLVPGAWHFNFGVYKDFKLTERYGLQFRTEMFNAFNHSNFYALTGGNADVSGLAPSTANPNIGFIQGKKGTDLGPILERRFFQFAMKLKF